MFVWRVRKGVLGFVLGMPLLACGGKSASATDPEAHYGAGTGQGGGASMGAQRPEPDDRAADSGGAGSASGGAHATGGGGTAARVDSAGNSGFMSGDAGAMDTVPERECKGEVCQLSVDSTPRWVTKLKGYGRGPAQIDFAGDPKVVRVGVGEHDYYVHTLDLATGELVEEPTKTAGVVAADRSGRRLVTFLEHCTAFIDGREAFRLSCGREQAVRFSADGSVISSQYCLSDTGGIQLEAYDTASGQLFASATADLPCIYGDVNVLVDTEHRRTVFGHPARSELFIFDWATQTVETRAIHQESPVSNHAPYNREGTILNVSLSSDGQHFVSVGAADGLAWLDPKTLAVQRRLPDVPFFNVYDRCYTTYLDESPIAWSPGGEIFATARPGGGVVLREVSTQKQLAVLDPPTSAEVIKASCSSEFGPVLMEFSPDMRSLLVLYPVHASVYSLSAH